MLCLNKNINMNGSPTYSLACPGRVDQVGVESTVVVIVVGNIGIVHANAFQANETCKYVGASSG